MEELDIDKAEKDLKKCDHIHEHEKEMLIAAARITDNESVHFLYELQEENRQLNEKVKKLLTLLQRMEWRGGECPECGNTDSQGHFSGCELAEALK